MTTPYGAPVPSHSEAPLSINFRIPEVPGSPQLTVRASNGQELAGLTGDVAAAGVQVGRALVDFRSGFLAGAGLPAETASSTPASAQSAQTYQPQNPTAGYGAPAPDQQQYSMPAQQYGAPPQHQYAAPPQTGGMGAAPTCPHGQRVYKSGVSPKSGQPYKMWACPAPQGPEQCKPEWVK